MQFGYNLSERLDDIRTYYEFDVSCQGSVPQSIISFLESTDYEDAVRNAISLGGDADTMACIAGGIAEAYYGSVPTHQQAGSRPIGPTIAGHRRGIHSEVRKSLNRPMHVRAGNGLLTSGSKPVGFAFNRRRISTPVSVGIRSAESVVNRHSSEVSC